MKISSEGSGLGASRLGDQGFVMIDSWEALGKIVRVGVSCISLVRLLSNDAVLDFEDNNGLRSTESNASLRSGRCLSKFGRTEGG